MTESATFVPPSPEALVQPVSSVEALRQTRIENAQQQAYERISRHLSMTDKTEDAGYGIPKVKNVDLGYSIGMLAPTDLMAFDAVGISPNALFEALETGASSDEEILTKQVGSEILHIDKYGNSGVSLRLDIEGEKADFDNPKSAVNMTVLIKQRYAKSPAYSAAAKLNAQHGRAPSIAQSIKSEPFDPHEDMLGTVAFMSEVGIFSRLGAGSAIRYGATPQELFNNPSDILTYNVQVTPTKDGYMYSKNELGLTTIVRVNTQTGLLTYELQHDTTYFYNEHANQVPQVEEVPFIDTVCAQEMLGALDSVGLMLHPKYQAEITRAGEAERFGSVYTQLSRELAKWVNRPSRVSIDEMFIRFDPSAHAKGNTYYGDNIGVNNYRNKLLGKTTDEERHTDLAIITERLEQIDASAMGEPAAILFGIVQDVIARSKGRIIHKDTLPVTASDVHIDGGACFDVAAYYIGAAAFESKKGLTSFKENGVAMLEKTHGSHTFMLQESAVLNGVRLPKGTLMQRGDDGGWAMLRLTPFTFDREEDRLATGSEMTKVTFNEHEAIHKLGGVSLKHIMNAVPQVM